MSYICGICGRSCNDYSTSCSKCVVCEKTTCITCVGRGIRNSWTPLCKNCYTPDNEVKYENTRVDTETGKRFTIAPY